MRIASILLALLVLNGCFVGEELDKGREIMEGRGKQQAPTAAPAEATDKPAPPSSAGKAEPGLFDELRAWTKREPAPEPPDPRDAPVRCDLGSRQLFSTRIDCETRGGRAVELPPR